MDNNRLKITLFAWSLVLVSLMSVSIAMTSSSDPASEITLTAKAGDTTTNTNTIALSSATQFNAFYSFYDAVFNDDMQNNYMLSSTIHANNTFRSFNNHLGWLYSYETNGNTCMNTNVFKTKGVVSNTCISSKSKVNGEYHSMIFSCDATNAYAFMYEGTDCNPMRRTVNMSMTLSTCTVKSYSNTNLLTSRSFGCSPMSHIAIIPPYGSWVSYLNYGDSYCGAYITYESYLNNNCMAAPETGSSTFYTYPKLYTYPNSLTCNGDGMYFTPDFDVCEVEEPGSRDGQTDDEWWASLRSSKVILVNQPDSSAVYQPTVAPTRPPTRYPTASPTRPPTRYPTTRPTRSPTAMPSRPRPTKSPTLKPTFAPSTSTSSTRFPSRPPNRKPSLRPTVRPSRRPSRRPSQRPASSWGSGW